MPASLLKSGSSASYSVLQPKDDHKLDITGAEVSEQTWAKVLYETSRLPWSNLILLQSFPLERIRMLSMVSDRMHSSKLVLRHVCLTPAALPQKMRAYFVRLGGCYDNR